MKYSDWQLNRVRDALRAYHQYERGIEDAPFTWKDVREGIAEETGVEIGANAKIGAERLRQFVEGLRTKDGGWKFPVLQDEWLSGVVQFVTSADNDLLSEDELRVHAPHRQAALRLLDYLAPKIAGQSNRPAAKLQGRFQARKGDEEEFVVRELILQKPSKEGLIEVTETEEFYPPEAASHYDAWSLKERLKQRDSIGRHGGWAILTPETNLLFFLKEEHGGFNRYYFTLASDYSEKAQPPLSQLILLHHDYPLHTEEEDRDKPASELLARAEEMMAGGMFLYRRTG